MIVARVQNTRAKRKQSPARPPARTANYKQNTFAHAKTKETSRVPNKKYIRYNPPEAKAKPKKNTQEHEDHRHSNSNKRAR
jgi:hypothetical protein